VQLLDQVKKQAQLTHLIIDSCANNFTLYTYSATSGCLGISHKLGMELAFRANKTAIKLTQLIGTTYVRAH